MSAADAIVTMRAINHTRRQLGLLLSGRVCLACGEPLFGPELLHAASLPERPTNLMDAIRYAGVMGPTHVA